MTKTLLLVDLSYQTYRATAAHPGLEAADGTFTGGLYGFLVTLAKTILDTEATHVVVCQDRKPYRRSLLYPEYKMLRKATQDEELKARYEATVPLVRTALDVIGLPVLGVDGFESDDIVAHFVHHRRGRYRTIYAASNDSDLFQLFWCPWFKVYRKDMADVMDYWKLKETTGLEPEEFMLATALQGTHNDVAGIPRVGPVTAIKAIKDLSLMRGFREQHADLIDRNLRLIRLPYEGFPREVELPPAKPFHHRSLYRYAARYDITVTASMLNAFEQVSP